MFVADRQQQLTALETLAPFAGGGRGVSLAAAEDGTVTAAVASDAGGARVQMLARVLLPGAVAVPLRSLTAALKCSHGARVEVATAPGRIAVHIDGEGSAPRKYTFPAPPGAGPAPEPPDAAGAVVASVPAASFRTLAERTVFASGPRRGGRLATDMIEFHAADGRLTLAATDNVRLAIAGAAAEVTGGRGATAFVPATAVRAWAKAAKRAEVVSLALGGVTTFTAGALVAWAAGSGPFVDWRSALTEPPHRFSIGVEPLRAGLRAALALAGDGEPAVTLALRPGGITVSATAGAARAAADVPVPGLVGPAVKVPVNGRLLLDTLAAYSDGVAVTVAIDTGERPIVITAADGSRCVVVPYLPRARPGAARASG